MRDTEARIEGDMDPYKAAAQMDTDEIVRARRAARRGSRRWPRCAYQSSGYRRVKNPRIWSLHDMAALVGAPGLNVDGALEMLLVEGDGAPRLASPGVGLFTQAVPRGEVLTPGRKAGWLLTLGRAAALVVPEGATGVVTTTRPERIHEPVGYGTVLYELSPLAPGGAIGAAPVPQAEAQAGELVFRSPQTGRFWHRPAPAEPSLVAEGQEVADGGAVGLIEVMKTFTPVVYRAARGLPARARIVRLLAADGAEVAEGAPLFELEPA